MRTYGRRGHAEGTYPERSPGSSGSGALVRVGYDGTFEEFEIPSGGTYLPRNAILDPLQVTFPAFTLGDTLEVDFKLNGSWESETPGLVDISTQIGVSVDGGVTFYTLVPSGTAAKADAGAGENNVVYLRSLDAITIVDPMPVNVNGFPGTTPVTSPPIVRVFYSYGGSDGTILINGYSPDELTLPGAILKCSELAAASIFQGPLGILAITT